MDSKALIIDHGRYPTTRAALAVLSSELERGRLATATTYPRTLGSELLGHDLLVCGLYVKAGQVRMALRELLGEMQIQPPMPPLALLLLMENANYGSGALAAFDELVRQRGLRLLLPPLSITPLSGRLSADIEQRVQIRSFGRQLVHALDTSAEALELGNTKEAALLPPLYTRRLAPQPNPQRATQAMPVMV